MTTINDLADITGQPERVNEPDPSVDVEPADVPRGGLLEFAPLNAEEQRELLNKTRDLHAWLGELREVKDRLPEIMDSMPPMMKMALGNFLKF